MIAATALGLGNRKPNFRAGTDSPASGTRNCAVQIQRVIASQVPMDSSLLCHELVHVVQYRLLRGIRPFAVQYVHGFLATGSYHEIPLEPCACQLEAEFVTGGAPFSGDERSASWRAWLPVSVLMKPAGVATERGWCS